MPHLFKGFQRGGPELEDANDSAESGSASVFSNDEDDTSSNSHSDLNHNHNVNHVHNPASSLLSLAQTASQMNNITGHPHIITNTTTTSTVTPHQSAKKTGKKSTSRSKSQAASASKSKTNKADHEHETGPGTPNAASSGSLVTPAQNTLARNKGKGKSKGTTEKTVYTSVGSGLSAPVSIPTSADKASTSTTTTDPIKNNNANVNDPASQTPMRPDGTGTPVGDWYMMNDPYMRPYQYPFYPYGAGSNHHPFPHAPPGYYTPYSHSPFFPNPAASATGMYPHAQMMANPYQRYHQPHIPFTPSASQSHGSVGGGYTTGTGTGKASKTPNQQLHTPTSSNSNTDSVKKELQLSSDLKKSSSVEKDKKHDHDIDMDAQDEEALVEADKTDDTEIEGETLTPTTPAVKKEKSIAEDKSTSYKKKRTIDNEKNENNHEKEKKTKRNKKEITPKIQMMNGVPIPSSSSDNQSYYSPYKHHGMMSIPPDTNTHAQQHPLNMYPHPPSYPPPYLMHMYGYPQHSHMMSPTAAHHRSGFKMAGVGHTHGHPSGLYPRDMRTMSMTPLVGGGGSNNNMHPVTSMKDDGKLFDASLLVNVNEHSPPIGQNVQRCEKIMPPITLKIWT